MASDSPVIPVEMQAAALVAAATLVASSQGPTFSGRPTTATTELCATWAKAILKAYYAGKPEAPAAP